MLRIDVRLEEKLANGIKNLAEKNDRAISDIIRYLAWIGIDAEKQGGVRIEGPLGIIRPFANIDLGQDQERITILIDDELKTELEKIFPDEDIRKALRAVLRVGFLSLGTEVTIIKGIFGGTRKHLKLETPRPKDKRAREFFQFLGGNLGPS